MEKKNSILIVDDDASNLMELSSILKSNYKVYAVKDGTAALEKANESMPDLILLDVVMPDMNGFEVLAELKRAENTKHIPVIFITGVNDSESEREGLSIGAVDYIRKPFDTMVVKHRVRIQIHIVNLQRELENSAAVAEAANQSKSSFLASMSHEIRTPMNAIMGITDILLQNEAVSPDEITEGLERIYTSGDMLLNLINDILDFSKIEAGKLDILPARYKIAGLIGDTVHLNMMRIGDKPIKFELSIDEDIPAKLVGDELRIKQILNNLLSNAFKYTDSGKVILTVSFQPEPAKGGITLVLTVQDTGYGMTKEQLDRLFDEYSRFDEGKNRSIEGTGLGLSIMHRLVTLMDGSVDVQSESGVGTTVTIRMPQETVDANVLGKKAAEDLQELRISSHKHREGSKFVREPMPYGKVLIVDDTETNLYVAVRFMKPYKLHIETAVTGREAIDKIESGNFYDVVFMDHMMPEMDGMEATKHLRDGGYTGTIVALTANAMTGQADMFLKNGFDEFISKPIDLTSLDSVLKAFIRDKQPAEVLKAALKQESDLRAEGASGATGALGALGAPYDDGPELDSDPVLVESFLLDAHKALTVLGQLCSKTVWFENDDDFRKYTIIVHGMKSILKHMGEAGLSDVAGSLETGGREKDVKLLELETPGFLEKLRVLVDKHEKSLNENSGGIIEEAAEDIGVLLDRLRSLEEKCAEYSRKGVLEILSGISERSEKTGMVLDEIRDFIGSSDFEEAGKKAAKYAAELSDLLAGTGGGGAAGAGAAGGAGAAADGGVRLIKTEIAGLNITRGLERYDGNESVYLKTLRSYAASTASILEQINSFDENKLSDYRVKVHGIKGASYDIHANNIGKLAEELENAAVNEDTAFITDHNPAFIESANSLVGDIDDLLFAIDAENPKPIKDKPDESLLLKLREACEIYSMDDVDDVMAQIEIFKYEADDGLVEKLRKCVDLMQFPQIVNMLKES